MKALVRGDRGEVGYDPHTQADRMAGVNRHLPLWLSAGCWELFFDFHMNFFEPRFAAFGAVAIVSKLPFQLTDAITSGLELPSQPLRGFDRLPGTLIGRICRLLQEIKDQLPSLIDWFEVIIVGVHTAV
jgi:hypothetical protein